MMSKLWLGACIVCIILLTVSMSLIGLYGMDVFDYTDDTYNQYVTMACYGVGIVTAVGLFASSQYLVDLSSKVNTLTYQTPQAPAFPPAPYRRNPVPQYQQIPSIPSNPANSANSANSATQYQPIPMRL